MCEHYVSLICFAIKILLSAFSLKVGIHVTEVQLSRAMGSLLRLIADVMADLVNQDGDAGEEDSEDSDIRLRRSVSAPILLTPPIGMLMPRKWRALTRNKNGMVQGSNGYLLTPLRSLVIARPANSVSRALICAAMGSTLAPIWTWISECLDDLEIRLRARLAWNSRRPNISAPEFLNVDSGTYKLICLSEFIVSVSFFIVLLSEDIFRLSCQLLIWILFRRFQTPQRECSRIGG